MSAEHAPRYVLNEMTWPEVDEALKTVEIALLPTGSAEQHGPNTTFFTDTGHTTVEAACDRIVEFIEDCFAKTWRDIAQATCGENRRHLAEIASGLVQKRAGPNFGGRDPSRRVAPNGALKRLAASSRPRRVSAGA